MMKAAVSTILKFLKENWFRVILLLLLFQAVTDFHRLVQSGLEVGVSNSAGPGRFELLPSFRVDLE